MPKVERNLNASGEEGGGCRFGVRVSEAIIRLFWFILSLGLGSVSTSGENTKSRLGGLQHRDSNIPELRNIP